MCFPSFAWVQSARFPLGVRKEEPDVIRFEIRRAAGSQPYYCRAVSVGNSGVLMTSETYHAKADAMRVAEIMRGGSGGAQVVDLT